MIRLKQLFGTQLKQNNIYNLPDDTLCLDCLNYNHKCHILHVCKQNKPLFLNSQSLIWNCLYGIPCYHLDNISDNLTKVKIPSYMYDLLLELMLVTKDDNLDIAIKWWSNRIIILLQSELLETITQLPYFYFKDINENIIKNKINNIYIKHLKSAKPIGQIVHVLNLHNKYIAPQSVKKLKQD